MPADASQLIPNERIVYETRKHWAAVVVDSIWAILLLLGAVVLTWLEGDSTSGITGFFNRVLDMLRLAAFFVGLGWIIYNVIAWRTAQFTVTNLRVFGHEGLLRRRESETLLTSLSDIQTSQGVLGRALGYGNIRIISAAGRPGTDTFTAVRDPGTFRRNIVEQKATGLQSNGAAPTAESRAEAVQVLSQLASLRDAGAITQAEYETKRAEWVAKI
jgi:uncharacterized membrane protein YdbT with pleckstrin-like domain